MSAVTKKKLIPASKAAGMMSGSTTIPRQNGLTSRPDLPSTSRSVIAGSCARTRHRSSAGLRGSAAHHEERAEAQREHGDATDQEPRRAGVVAAGRAATAGPRLVADVEDDLDPVVG